MVFWKKKHWEDEYDEYYTRDIERGGKGEVKWAFVPHFLGLLLLGVIFAGAIGVVSGPRMLEMLLTSLAMPIGILWLALMLLVYFCLLNKQAWPAMVGIACWLVLTLAGNGFVASWLANSIEHPFQSVNPLEEEPYDLIVLLGGGTGTRLSGQPQVMEAGDRLVTAARIFNAGKAKRIMCTGVQTFRSTEKDLHPHEEASLLLAQLGIPEEKLIRLKGANTSEEMQNLKKYCDKSPEDQRIGLVTSAWHLPRALRLAKANGIEPEPIPSNFLGEHFTPGPDLIVPTGNNLATTALMMKEILAGFVGR